MNQIEEKYQEFKSQPFPDGLAGEEVLGIDLVMLDADTAGLIEKYISNNFKLTVPDFDLLKRLNSDLKTVTKELNANPRIYFAGLWNLADRIISELEQTKRLIQSSKSEQFHKKWKVHLMKIREILNDWDPIGVADTVDDEYDSINFAAYSALMNSGTTDSIKGAIREYLNNSMGIDETEEKLNEISEKIKNAVQH